MITRDASRVIIILPTDFLNLHEVTQLHLKKKLTPLCKALYGGGVSSKCMERTRVSQNANFKFSHSTLGISDFDARTSFDKESSVLFEFDLHTCGTQKAHHANKLRIFVPFLCSLSCACCAHNVTWGCAPF